MKPAPTVVIAGERRTDRGGLARTLLRGAGLPAADRAAAPAAYTVHRHADEPYASAYIPGFREPRSLALADEVGPGDPYAVLAVSARPPRRVELGRPVDLLRHLTLVDAPEADVLDRAHADVLADVLGDGGALLFRMDAGRRLRDSEVAFLAGVVRRRTPVAFAVFGEETDPLPARDALCERVPALAAAPWFAVHPDGDPAALREALVDMATATPPPAEAARPVRSPAEAWHAVLDREIGRCRLAALRQLAASLGDTQERCQRRTTGAGGFRLLPVDLDRELHALSVRLSRVLDASCRYAAERTVWAVLGHRPDRKVFDRVAGEVRAAWAESADQVLLVTSTGGVTALAGPGSRDSLSARPTLGSPSVARPVDIALTAGCYLLWTQRSNAHPAEVGLWLQRAVDSVAAELLNEVVNRCYEVHRALVVSLGGLVDRIPVGGVRTT